MKSYLAFALCTLSLPAFAAPFMYTDPTSVARVTHCVLHSANSPTSTLIRTDAVEAVTGGERCKVDLLGIADANGVGIGPYAGATVYLAFRDAAANSGAGETGPMTAYTFGTPPTPLESVRNIRIGP